MSECELKACFAVLGLSELASLQDVKSAYRALARRFHPDLNRDNHQAAHHFREITAAYRSLLDHRHLWMQPRPRSRPKPAAASPRPTAAQQDAVFNAFAFAFGGHRKIDRT